MSHLSRLLALSLVTSTVIGATPLTEAYADDMGLMASNAWSRPTAMASMAGVVYATVTDHGASTSLVGASTPVATHAELHQSKEENGMMEMLPVKSIPISAAAPITFSPGGYHIMLTGLTKALSTGQTFPITFIFANGAKVTTTVTVKSMTSDGSTGSESNGMGGMKM